MCLRVLVFLYFRIKKSIRTECDIITIDRAHLVYNESMSEEPRKRALIIAISEYEDKQLH